MSEGMIDTLRRIDIPRMMHITGVPLSKIKDALRAPLPSPAPENISTFKELLQAYDKTPVESKEEDALLCRIIALASTPEEAREAHKRAPEGSEKREAAFKKWRALFAEAVEAASTDTELRYVLPYIPRGSEEEKTALEKLHAFYVSKIETASSIKEILEIYNNLPAGDEVVRVAVNKMITLAVTPEEARCAYTKTSKGSEEQRKAFFKWCVLSLAEVAAASSFLEVWKAYENAPDESEAKRGALLKMLSLSATIHEIKTTYMITVRGSREWKAALGKWCALSRQEMERASTIEGIMTAHKKAPEGSEEQRIAIKKMANFFPK